ncbi:MAG TPA: hypothetical protein VGC58_02565 [Candidatus Paceibacterota bacterium]
MKSKYDKIWFFSVRFILIIIAVIFTGMVAFAAPPEEISESNIVVKVGNGSGYEDGDILVAMNCDRALQVNAENLMRPYDMPRGDNNTIKKGTLLEYYYQRIYEYKFQRISDKVVKRTNLFTGQIDVISDVSNSQGEYIDVPLFIERRITKDPGGNVIFGEKGSEYWYSGNVNVTKQALDQVWSEIKTKKRINKSCSFPFTEAEKKNFAVLRAPDMTKEEVEELVKPLTVIDRDGKEAIIKNRKYKINLENILTTKEKKDFSDSAKSKDLRNRTINISNSIVQK